MLAGSFFIRNSEWSRRYLQQGIFILNLVLDYKNWSPDWAQEQAAMMNVMDKYNRYKDHFKWISPRLINAYPHNMCGEGNENMGVYHDGGNAFIKTILDFIIHFAGRGHLLKKLDYWTDWLQKVTGLDDIYIP
jgi:hypothetical protein